MDDIATLQAKYGITPKASSGASSGVNRTADLDAAWGSKPGTIQEQGSFYGGGENSIGSKLITDVKEGSADFTGDGSVKSLLGPTKAVFRGVGDVAGAVFHPIGAAIDKITGGKLNEAFQSIANQSPKEGSLMDKITNSPIVRRLAMENPHLSEDFQRALNIIFLGSANAETLPNGEKPTVDTLVERTKPQIEAIKNSPETIINKADEFKTKVGEVKDKVVGAVKNKVAGTSGDPIQDSIDAVNPDLTGKKLTGAYKQVVTGQRQSVPSSIFKEQGLTPSEQTTNLGTRLSDLQLGKDHVENLNKLSTALQDTETKVNTALDANPDIPTERDTLLENLDKGKTEALPREFKGIKDSSNAFQDVIDFSKEIIDKSDDNFKALREARTEFDSQAKLEYPNAFKDGMIDVKTPAGRAIKFVRDTINKHLYDVAPNGSEIQDLIGREADIFRATESIAPKAAATHGQTGLEQAIDKHPVIKAGVNTVKKAIPFGIGTHL